MATHTEPRVDRLLTPRQVAETLAVSKRTAKRWSEAGVLPVVRVVPHGHARYRERDVEAVIERGLGEQQ
jgi:excisionase family DNA binding protein